MKDGEENWMIEWIKSLGCELWYTVHENEVWRNKNYRILVWNPSLGLRMMFHATNMSEKVQKEIIEKILSDQQKKIDHQKKHENRLKTALT
jgi:hypothetical protein